MELLERVTQYLQHHELKLITAESCTAGLMVSELARVPGSGQSIDSGLAVYSPEAKNRYLSVSFDTIDTFGLTSEETAREMARGSLDNSDANVSVANTGIAGPKPQDDIPVGTVCFAWAFRHDQKTYLATETRRFPGERNEVRLAAAHYALENIPVLHRQMLEGNLPIDR
ncbi:PncC family amidohydrolase [Vreelandella songnenensis]|uniref:PncC family amidohydrolase n=1 Tax=Vreelandella songnenensis TaxID=1176243 RepID=A0A2T0V967_9GAMM|nr:CinA family protein [Halomonas songnenensis]PRY66598.1 PncC family amidohydrolase [Halomonas songnenensis]